MRAAALVMAILLLAPMPATPQPGPDCERRAALVARLARDFSETLRFIAAFGRHARLEIFVSPHGTWTVATVSLATGRACVAGVGTNWRKAGIRS